MWVDENSGLLHLLVSVPNHYEQDIDPWYLSLFCFVFFLYCKFSDSIVDKKQKFILKILEIGKPFDDALLLYTCVNNGWGMGRVFFKLLTSLLIEAKAHMDCK